MDKRATVVLAVIFGGLFLLLFAFLLLAFAAVRHGAGDGWEGGGPAVGVIKLKGVIGRDPTASATAFDKAVQHFAHDDEVKAVVVRINSPGGSVAPSQEMNEALRRLSRKKKVVVSMGDLAASGGYYVASAADYIFAEPGTLTASIGVISEFFDVHDLMGLLHVGENTIKSGALKDVGSPFRPMTDGDKQYFQSLIDDVYQQFLAAVARGRHLQIDQFKAIADGRALTGEQALHYRLIDALGSFHDAVEKAALLGGIRGEPRLAYPPKENDFSIRDLLQEGARSLLGGGALARGIFGPLVARPPSGVLLYLMPGAGW